MLIGRGSRDLAWMIFFTLSDEGQILTREVFRIMNRMIEVRNRDIEEASRSLPNVRIGLLVPENKIHALAKKKDEIFSESLPETQ